MKVVLVLCLLAFMSCQKDIMDIAKCLYESPKVKEIIADVMVAVATKDFSKLWPKIKEALPELIPVVIKCVTENEVTLQFVKPIITKWQHQTQNHELQEAIPIVTYGRCIYDCVSHIRNTEEDCLSSCNEIIFQKFDDKIAQK